MDAEFLDVLKEAVAVASVTSDIRSQDMNTKEQGS
jgi:hypothetical protein